MFSPAPAGSGVATPVSLATNAIKGVSAIQSVYTTKDNCGASNAACVNLVWEQGPYGGADPSDRMGLFDVKRFSDGQGANKVFVNGVKAQGAMEALRRAGVTAPFSSVAKRDATVAPLVFIEDNGNYPYAVFGSLPLDKQNYTGAASSTAASAGFSAYPTLAQFPNGISLVGQTPASGASVSSPVMLPTGSCGKSTPAGFAKNLPYDPSSFAGQLDQDSIPGVSLFSYPQAEGAITTLQNSGAQVIADLADNNIVGAINEANPAYMGAQYPLPQMIPLPRSAGRQTQAATGLASVPTGPGVGSPWTAQTTAAPYAYAVPFKRPCGFTF